MSTPIKQSSAAISFPFLMVDSTDHITGKPGLTCTVTLSKNAGAFAAAAGAVTEIGNGWYKLAANATDSNTLGKLILHATATGADPTDVEVATVVAFDPYDAVRAGLTALPNAAAAATGGLPTVDSTGAVKTQATLRKNQALAGFEFLMTDSVNHNPATGKTVALLRSIDGGAFAAGTLGAVTEVAYGIYATTIPAADLNGTVVTIRATATGCDDLDITLLLEP